MAIPKFPLKTADRTEIRTLEELRENADFHTLAGWYEDGSLRRWLLGWHYAKEAKALEELDSAAAGFCRALYGTLGMAWTEEMEAEYIDETIKQRMTVYGMSDKAADAVAFNLNHYPYHELIDFAETENYVLAYDANFWPAEWFVYPKKVDEISAQKFSTDNDAFMPNSSQETPIFSNPQSRGTYGDTVICISRGEDGKRRIISIDIKEKTVKLLKENVEGEILSDVVNGRFAYGGGGNGLWLFDLQGNEAIPVVLQSHPGGDEVQCALLAGETLYYIKDCWDDAGLDVDVYLYAYNLVNKKNSLVTRLGYDLDIYALGIAKGRIYFLGTEIDKVLFGVVSAQGGEVGYYHLDGRGCPCKDAFGETDFTETAMLAYQDCFAVVGGNLEHQYLTVVEFDTGKAQAYSLWDIEQQIKASEKELSPEICQKYLDRLRDCEFFRLGDWLYYSIDKIPEDDDLGPLPYERWKISLETGERVKLYRKGLWGSLSAWRDVSKKMLDNLNKMKEGPTT